ncbi:MAG: NADH-quinone oxidoreductase subunit J [Nitrospirae bacterium]|nr:NADH-quinone oxidoreductase subunit J [Nitrospirota bacterium]NTW66864.1 NADH-quinone oxidoreductase subunit J [Nitrospirota bacterium]
MINQLIFLYFAAVIIVSAVLMVTRRNPIHSVMFMLLLFFHIAGVFVLLNAEFLAAVQLIVYAGAILILYLFVVMLLSVDRETQAVRANRFWPWLVGFGFVIAAEIALLVLRGTFPADRGQAVKNAGAGVRELGVELYTKYLVPFEIASVILLVGLVGAVMLAKKRTTE